MLGFALVVRAEGEFNTDIGNAVVNCLSTEAIQHTMDIAHVERRAALVIVLEAARCFVLDDADGHLNASATSNAFTDAVLNVAPEMIEKASALSGKRRETPVGNGVILIGIVAACATFVNHPPGNFDKAAFNAAFQNLDESRIRKAQGLIKTEGGMDALSFLLSASGYFVKDRGVFKDSLFNERFDSLDPSSFSGDKDQRLITFLKLMRRYEEGHGIVTTPNGQKVTLGTRCPCTVSDKAADATNSKVKGEPTRDIEAIQDAIRIKLLMAALGNRNSLGGFDLRPDGMIVPRRPPWLDRVVESMSKELDTLLRKYEINLATSKITSEGKFDMSIGTSTEGSYSALSLEMANWSDIITVTPSGRLPVVKIKSGKLQFKLPSTEVVLETGTVCSVKGNQYVLRSGRWTAAK